MHPGPELPDDLRAMLEAIRAASGRPRLVGGGVRDWLLGLAPGDFDIEVGGLDFEGLRRRLAPFGPTDIVGRSFGVVKVRGRQGREYARITHAQFAHPLHHALAHPRGCESGVACPGTGGSAHAPSQ